MTLLIRQRLHLSVKGFIISNFHLAKFTLSPVSEPSQFFNYCPIISVLLSNNLYDSILANVNLLNLSHKKTEFN